MKTSSYERTPIGVRVASYRKARGFKTQQALAEAAGLPKATVVNIEAGRKSDPSIGDLLALAWALRLSPLALLFDLEKPFSPSDLGELMPEGWRSVSVLGLISLFRLDVNMSVDDDEGLTILNDPAYLFDHARALVQMQQNLEARRRKLDKLRETDPENAEIVGLERSIEQLDETMRMYYRVAKPLELEVPPESDLVELSRTDDRAPNPDFPYTIKSSSESRN